MSKFYLIKKFGHSESAQTHLGVFKFVTILAQKNLFAHNFFCQKLRPPPPQKDLNATHQWINHLYDGPSYSEFSVVAGIILFYLIREIIFNMINIVDNILYGHRSSYVITLPSWQTLLSQLQHSLVLS